MRRSLGTSGIQVSPVGFGCWAIGGHFYDENGDPVGWGQTDDAQSLAAIDKAVEMGVTFFETADVYGTGRSEEILGKALAGRRDQIVLATKFGKTFDPVQKRMLGFDASPAYIRGALEASLQRLGTDYIDLYQFHIWDYPAAAAEPVRQTLEDLVAQGKIRAYGWAAGTVAQAKAFAQGPNFVSLQHNLNLFEADAELLNFCQRLGLTSINTAPLAMGLLTGKYDRSTRFGATDVRRYASSWSPLFTAGRPTETVIDRLEAVREILQSGGRTLAQGALAWIWGRSPITVPIPGFKNVQQAEENARAMEWGPLTEAQMDEIETLLAPLPSGP
ncbi:MAG: aldo/keto reductase [Candidatus Latescibacteria bacterium]|nr:aldo/keto reductase [Candidatus Latescibacterota bacterium]